MVTPRRLGRYRLLSRVATGGMAELWLAFQTGPSGVERPVVLKLIHPDLAGDREYTRMFLDEARITALIDHHNVVRIYDVGEVDDQVYLAMEYLPGEDVGALFRAVQRAPGELPIPVACEIAIQAARGLHAAHEARDVRGRRLEVVHRDVSPSNLIITYDGAVKVLDFGVARARSNLVRTSTGMVRGKTAYLSPEQAVGESVDGRSDIFSLGTVLRELLTLERTFRRENDLATLKAILTEQLEPPSARRPSIPQALDEIVMTAMQLDRSRRYQSMAELAGALTAFLEPRGGRPGEEGLARFMIDLFGEDERERRLSAFVAVSEEGGATLDTEDEGVAAVAPRPGATP